ncbi:hypothetical protein MANES_03G009200v8 [Manihot esculenta]|uniref:Uncharacterized protein n=2 Tax=Manihot esculenta TaxID=3983 RepID=A0ACB7HXH6_MANES|nr:hypothetical protein MANES_03G009200v8 [Manihot esculenta]KAG8656811.1 hypothetical protein MANES_03G009200v8 [Manihot esculenta]
MTLVILIGSTVFGCCFKTDILDDDDEYKDYIGSIASELHDYFPDSSFMVFNFKEGENQSQIGSKLSENDMTVMDYPLHYEGCPLLTLDMIHHFLRSSESWLSLQQQNMLLMHCERGGWPILAFMLAALLIHRKQFTGEQKTLEMIYKQAPRELLQLMSPLNPLPSQLRYLQYVSRSNTGSHWPPMDRALTLDCVILRVIPNMNREGGCRPIFRIYGQDPLMVADRTPKVLFSRPKRSKLVRHYKQEFCDLIKIDIHCHIQGDVVMECISVESDLEREQLMFRVVFNTAFINSNILMLNRDEIDTLWNVKDKFPKDFRAEVLFSEMDSTSSRTSIDLPVLEGKGGLRKETFAKVQEVFSNVGWLDTRPDVALNVLQHITALQEDLEAVSPQKAKKGSNMPESNVEKVQDESFSAPHPPPPPPPPSFSGPSPLSAIKKSHATLLPPPPTEVASLVAISVSSPQLVTNSAVISGSPPPSPPPFSGSASGSFFSVKVPPPPPPPSSARNSSNNSARILPVPPPPAPFSEELSKQCAASLPSSRVSKGIVPSVPGPPSGPPFSVKGRGLSRPNPRSQVQPKKANLRPYHWLKLTRVMQGSLWAETQKSDEASKAPEFDMAELESLFSAAAPTGQGGMEGKSNRRTLGRKSDKVQLIELRRAYNCEIMLSKVKVPLSDLMISVLAMDDSALDVDQIDNLIKFCPTKEETALLKGYNGDKENLGKCEQFFLEMMKVPRVESKLRVFSFKLQFNHQVSDLRRNLNVVNSAAEEIRSSVKLKRVMQTILSLGNALNHGTARGSAVGFRLDSLLKLTDTRARNNKMTLMHYLCKMLDEKRPELLEFPKDLTSLEAATKIQLKYLAEEMQAISKGLEKVAQELIASENDVEVSENFGKYHVQILRAFLDSAEREVRSLAPLFVTAGRNADALAVYFGEDPARFSFEQVVSTLRNFVKMFVRAREENYKQLEFEKRKAEREEKMRS